MCFAVLSDSKHAASRSAIPRALFAISFVVNNCSFKQGSYLWQLQDINRRQAFTKW